MNMRKIGNILTKGSFKNDWGYNVVSSKEELIQNIPTLVIGWDFTKENYPEANIIDWKINDLVYWTFGNRERRAVYEERIEKFNELAANEFVKSVTYKPVSILTLPKEEKTELFNMLDTSESEKVMYIRSDMVYFYVKDEETVYGISLRDVSYIGKNVNSFLSAAYKCNNCRPINKDVSENIPSSVLYRLRNHIYIVPCLF